MFSLCSPYVITLYSIFLRYIFKKHVQMHIKSIPRVNVKPFK